MRFADSHGDITGCAALCFITRKVGTGFKVSKFEGSLMGTVCDKLVPAKVEVDIVY